MQRYNIALLPIDTALQRLFIECAISHFGKSADGYLLGEDALAHITLSQFDAPSDQTALHIYTSWVDRTVNSIELTLERFNLRNGSAEHAGKVWAEFLVKKKTVLLKYQESCFNHLMTNGIKPLSATTGYSPHVTLARLATQPNAESTPHATPIMGVVAFRPALGLSTENGVFVKEL